MINDSQSWCWGGAWSWGIGIRIIIFIIVVGEYLHVIDLQASTCWLPVLMFNIPDQDWLHVTPCIYTYTYRHGSWCGCCGLSHSLKPSKNKTEPKTTRQCCTFLPFLPSPQKPTKTKEIQQQLQAVRAFMVKPFEMNGNMASFIIPSWGPSWEVGRDSLGTWMGPGTKKHTHKRTHAGGGRNTYLFRSRFFKWQCGLITYQLTVKFTLNVSFQQEHCVWCLHEPELKIKLAFFVSCSIKSNLPSNNWGTFVSLMPYALEAFSRRTFPRDHSFVDIVWRSSFGTNNYCTEASPYCRFLKMKILVTFKESFLKWPFLS